MAEIIITGVGETIILDAPSVLQAAIVGGADKQVQFNDAGAIAGAVGLEWDKVLSELSIDGLLTMLGNIDLVGNLLTLDADKDTIIYSLSDDNIYFKTSDTIRLALTVSQLILLGGTDLDTRASFISSTTAALRLGGAGTPTHGDLPGQTFVAGTLEVGGMFFADGQAQFFGATTFAGVYTTHTDNKRLNIGTSLDYWLVYNSTGTAFELWSTNVDGGGTDGLILSVQDGSPDVVFGGAIETPKTKDTIEGGYAVRLTNKTGAASVKGTIVEASATTDDAVETAVVDSVDPIGVIYEDGIADGSEVWVVVSGVVEVLLEDATAATRRNWVRTGSTTAGRADATTGSPPGASLTHWQEIGHCIQSVTAGTDELARIALHFN